MSDKTITDDKLLKTAKSMLMLNGAVHPGGVVSQMPAVIKDEQGPADVVLLFAMNQKELDQYCRLPRRRWATRARCGLPT